MWSLSKMVVYNKAYLYIGAILTVGASFYSAAKHVNNIYVTGTVVLGLFYMLMAFKKPKRLKKQNYPPVN